MIEAWALLKSLCWIHELQSGSNLPYLSSVAGVADFLLWPAVEALHLVPGDF
jgi:hypothetical protein